MIEVCQHLQVSSGRFDWHFSDVHCPRTAQKSPKRAILTFGHLRGGVLCYRWGSVGSVIPKVLWKHSICRRLDDLSTSYLGGGNSSIFYLQPYLGKDFQFDSYFSNGLVQPPTRSYYLFKHMIHLGLLMAPLFKDWLFRLAFPVKLKRYMFLNVFPDDTTLSTDNQNISGRVSFP